MKLKLSQIIEAREALTRLASEKYPANIAYRIQRNIRALEPEINGYNKTREDMIKNKYGVEIEGRVGSYQVPPKQVPEFNAEIGLLLEEEVELDIRTISLDAIHDISPLDMMMIEWMFDMPDQPAEETPAGSYRQSHRVGANRNGKKETTAKE